MENDAFLAEHDVFVGNVALQVDVDACADAVHMADDTVDAGFPVEHADLVREVVDDGEVVFGDDHGFLLFLEACGWLLRLADVA